MRRIFDFSRTLDPPGYDSFRTDQDKTTAEYNVIASSYLDVTAVHAAQEHVHIDMGIKFMQTDLRVVADFGCAFGRDVQFWLDNGFEYYGIDASEEMLALAKRINPTAHFFQGDFIKTPLEAGSCGLVWASSTLQHVPHRFLPTVLANAAQALVPGGVFYANYRPPKDGVPVEGMLTSTEYTRTDGGPNVVERFTAHYGRDEMIQLLTDAGLTVVEGSDYDEIYHTYNADKAAYLPKKEIVFARK